MAFEKAENHAAYAKVGIMGMQGSGKTYLAKEMSIGLHKLLVSRGMLAKDTPVFFMDTETGSDFMLPYFSEAGIEVQVDKTRAFTSLVPAIEEVAKHHGILIIDSVTHFWKELCESYAVKKRRHDLIFSDWAFLKHEWGKFTNAFVNSECHIIMCGRAGYEYDFFENTAGKKELIKTGIRMKAEAETGYEPSLLILTQHHQTLENGEISEVYRTAFVVKDRTSTIDGKTFRNATFDDFKPHVDCLNLGGKHIGVDTSVSSEDIIPDKEMSGTQWKLEHDATLDEIKQYMLKLYPSTSKADKQGKVKLMEEFFGTPSWKRIEATPLDELKRCFSNMIATHGKPTEIPF